LLGVIALANPGQAANLVQNESFENNSGPGSILGGHPISNWDLINISGTGSSIHAINTLAQLQAAAYAASTPIALWGASVGYVNGNGIRNSNDGGYFIIADGYLDFYSIYRQTIHGLTPGKAYDMKFEYAYTQPAAEDGDTNQEWTVAFGSETYETPEYNLPSRGFYGGNESYELANR
jgi:hypothetical protein